MKNYNLVVANHFGFLPYLNLFEKCFLIVIVGYKRIPKNNVCSSIFYSSSYTFVLQLKNEKSNKKQMHICAFVQYKFVIAILYIFINCTLLLYFFFFVKNYHPFNINILLPFLFSFRHEFLNLN